MIEILLGTGIACFLLMGLGFWRLQKNWADFLDRYQETLQQPATLPKLQRQVDEIHQTMGGVIHTLRAMGHQVYTLNILAGNVLKEGQTDSHEVSQVLLDLENDTLEVGEDRQRVAFEDMPPEMQDKVRAFQAIYRAILKAEELLPSCNRPDLN